MNPRLNRLADLEDVIAEGIGRGPNPMPPPESEVLDLPNVRRERLKSCEARIAGAFTTAYDAFVDAGKALTEVRDDGLYLELGPEVTFEKYIRERLGMDKSRGYQLMDLASLDAIASTAVDALPIESERAARELGPVLHTGGPEMVAEAWMAVSERYRGERPPTGPEVRRVLVELGYRPRPGQSVGGRMSAFVALGTVGERIGKLELRAEGFFKYDLKKRKIGKETRERAVEYASRLEALAAQLREFGEKP